MRRAAALLLLGSLASAQTPDYSREAIPGLPGLLWDDARTVYSAPASWTASDWRDVGLGAAAVVGAGLLLDHTFADAAARNATPGRDRIAKDIAQAGGTGGLVLMGAGYLTFTLAGKDEARSVVVDMGIATVLAQAAILPLKYGFGRVRPADDQGTHTFKPLTSNDSFPSGHTTQAFAMASALSLRVDDPWVGACAYGVAGLVAVARMETRDHFVSDVLAGALIGTGIGRATVRADQAIRFHGGKAQVSFTPAFGPGYQGLAVSARF
jgi:membrane-associated phospholipid phosphatase